MRNISWRWEWGERNSISKSLDMKKIILLIRQVAGTEPRNTFAKPSWGQIVEDCKCWAECPVRKDFPIIELSAKEVTTLDLSWALSALANLNSYNSLTLHAVSWFQHWACCFMSSHWNCFLLLYVSWTDHCLQEAFSDPHPKWIDAYTACVLLMPIHFSVSVAPMHSVLPVG
jgi:hypothetical protein